MTLLIDLVYPGTKAGGSDLGTLAAAHAPRGSYDRRVSLIMGAGEEKCRAAALGVRAEGMLAIPRGSHWLAARSLRRAADRIEPGAVVRPWSPAAREVAQRTGLAVDEPEQRDFQRVFGSSDALGEVQARIDGSRPPLIIAAADQPEDSDAHRFLMTVGLLGLSLGVSCEGWFPAGACQQSRALAHRRHGPGHADRVIAREAGTIAGLERADAVMLVPPTSARGFRRELIEFAASRCPVVVACGAAAEHRIDGVRRTGPAPTDLVRELMLALQRHERSRIA